MPGLIEGPAQIWVAVVPVDMRRGLDGLSAIVQHSLGHSPGAGSAFIFRNRAGNRLRLLLWDGNEVWLCQRRLHRGSFVCPRPLIRPLRSVRPNTQGHKWQWLVAGVDWQRLSAQPSAEWRV